jgi:uncharacterized membrane protein
MQINETIDIAVPAESAYLHWTYREAFPRFLSGVDRVEEDGQGYSHWMVSLFSLQREFEAKVQSSSGNRIVWTSEPDGHYHGEVRFDPLNGGRCRMTVAMSMAPQGMAERMAVSLGLIRRRVRKVVDQFKHHAETVEVPGEAQPSPADDAR